MSTEPERVKQCLLSKWSIVAPGDWLEACLDWLHEDEQGSLLATQVNERVYEQWLLSNLREIGAVCLPSDLPQTQKMELRGRFCLQMNSIVDVSASYYSQLQKSQGTENENVRVTATQLTQTQVKPNRLLMMKLTDGSVEVQGMEYQPIPCLHTSLSPGVKIQIRGPVLCRLGVLMLKRDNVQILGGEVEELVAENSYQVLLTRALNPQADVGENPPQGQHPPFPGDPAGGSRVRDGSDYGDSIGRRDKDRDQNPVVTLKGIRGASADTEPAADASLDPLSAEVLDAMDEEWDSNLDLIDDFEQQGHIKVIDTTTVPDESHIKVKTESQSSNLPPSGYDRHKTLSPWQQASASRQQQNILETSTLQQDPVKWTRVTPGECSGIDRKCVTQSTSDSVNLLRDVRSKHTMPSLDMVTEISTEASGAVKTEEFIDLTQTVTSYNESTSTAHGHNLPCKTEMGFTASTFNRTVSLEGASTVGEQDDFSRHEKSLPLTNDAEISPYSYLSQIHWPPTQTRIIHIKAYVSTLVSKLDHGGGSKWSLRVKLNDGSAAVDCDLADEMLTSLIGFSAAESLKMKQVAKTDKGVRRRLVELSPDRPRPYVLGHRAPTPQDWTALQERISQS